MAKPSNTRGKWLDLRVANIQGGQLTLADKKWLNLPDEQIERFSLKHGDVVLAPVSPIPAIRRHRQGPGQLRGLAGAGIRWITADSPSAKS